MATLSELHTVLYRQLNRLDDDNMQGDALNSEIERSKAISSISKEIIGAARVQLDYEIKRADMREDSPRLEILK